MSRSLINTKLRTHAGARPALLPTLAATALFALTQLGCGSSTPAAKTPTKVPAGTALPGANGVPSGPSNGPSNSEKPRMNAAAAEAYSAGMRAFNAGDLAGARAQFTRAVQADARAFQAYYSLGVVEERLGATGQALNAYRQAVSIIADYEPAIAAYGILLSRLGKPDEAVEYLTNRQAQLPKSASVTAALAEVKSAQGDSASAQRLAQEALKKNPDFRPAMVTLARDHYRARRLDLALYTLKGILDGYGDENPARDKNNAEARLLRGLIYKEQNFRGPSMQEFEKALENRPDLVEARVFLAAYLLESGNAQKAAELLEGALRYGDNHVLARLSLGDAYRLLGRAAEAKRELEWVLQKDSSIVEAHYNLGLLYLFSDNVPGVPAAQAADRAVAEFEAYKKQRPRKPGSAPDDTDELITRAKAKKALVEAKATEQPAAPATPAPQPQPQTGAAAPQPGAAAAPPAAQPATQPPASTGDMSTAGKVPGARK